MVDYTDYLIDEAATVESGRQLGEAVGHYGGAVVFLLGDLGAGKTTLTRGVLQAFGYSGAVKSPTYTLVEPYELGQQVLYHFDLYRLGDPEELEYMGIRDYFESGNTCLIEWPGRGRGFLPEADIEVELSVAKQPESVEIGRTLKLRGKSEKGKKLVQYFADQRPLGAN